MPRGLQHGNPEKLRIKGADDLSCSEWGAYLLISMKYTDIQIYHDIQDSWYHGGLSST